MIEFVEQALESGPPTPALLPLDPLSPQPPSPPAAWRGGGTNVIVHCLAGAHRAGTTGCILLMHFAGLEKASAAAPESDIDAWWTPAR